MQGLLNFRRLSQKNLEFEASLGISVRSCVKIKEKGLAGHWWLMLVILATQEAEIRRMAV
jgi:hypothetical protein